ncbi:MAG: hypothetical protein R3F05_20195 [Planctomycetota bacterium]
MTVQHRGLRWALILVLLLLVAPPASAEDDATPAELARVRYELSKVEQKLKDAGGMAVELSEYDRRAFTMVKDLADKFPRGEGVAKLVAEARDLYRAAKGVGLEITPEMLAYRKRAANLSAAVSQETEAEWEKLRLEVLGDLDFLEKPFPVKHPPEVSVEDMESRRLILENVPYERALFLQSGVRWLAVGEPSTGFYWVWLGDPTFDALYEALRRYQSQVRQVVPEMWTIVGEVVGADVLAPGGGKPGEGTAYPGWVVQPTAIYLPRTVLLLPDASRDDGARFAGEDKLTELLSYSVTSVPDDVTPERLLEIYITALKEKNWDLHLACIDPQQHEHGPQLDHFRYTWEVQQKGIERLHAHAMPVEVGDVVVTRGFVDEGLESFFGEEGAKPPNPSEKEERVRVTVRLFDDQGHQTVRQRYVTLIRRGGGRWYIYSGATLMF